MIGVLDDPTRLTCCELHAEENAVTVTATLRRTASWFREQGCLPLETVMSDNHEAYTSTAFTSLLAELGTRQIAHPPTRRAGTRSSASSAPRREWSHSRTWPNSTARDRALASFMRFYNRRRPHSAANRRTPITRVQQVREQDG